MNWGGLTVTKSRLHEFSPGFMPPNVTLTDTSSSVTLRTRNNLSSSGGGGGGGSGPPTPFVPL